MRTKEEKKKQCKDKNKMANKTEVTVRKPQNNSQTTRRVSLTLKKKRLQTLTKQNMFYVFF